MAYSPLITLTEWLSLGPSSNFAYSILSELQQLPVLESSLCYLDAKIIHSGPLTTPDESRMIMGIRHSQY